MGPILLAQATTPVLKKVSSKEKRSNRSSENVGLQASSRKGKVSQNHRPQKKAVAQSKDTFRGKDSSPGSEKQGSQSRGKSKPELPSSHDSDSLLRVTREMDPKSSPSPLAESSGENLEQPQSQSNSEDGQQCAGRVRSRSTLTLPLAPPREPCQEPGRNRQPFSLESMRLYEQKEDDTDSASDLSDSERLPVLPSPCTPPQLNLRAEVFDSSDLRPCFPESRSGGLGNNGYMDFLPPPFCTWSLRQLAIFLNTEGRGAPRPKPVGKLERYLERLLQLEWLQIQTIEAESSRPAASGFPVRPRRQSTAPRYNSFPNTHPSSPKTLRQCQCAFPLAVASYPPLQHSHAVCPSCHVRFPLYNGICSSYAYHRHSRLSPVLERRAKAGVPPKRSSSESRVPAGQAWRLGSSTVWNGHLQRMQSFGNARSHSQASGTTATKPQGGPRNGNTGASAACPKDSVAMEKGAPGKNVRQTNPLRGTETVRPKGGSRDGEVQLGGVGVVRHHSPVSKVTAHTRTNGNVKHAHFVANQRPAHISPYSVCNM